MGKGVGPDPQIQIQIQIQFYWTCSQKAKNQKAKQTVKHRNNIIHNKKWNAMEYDEKITMNQG